MADIQTVARAVNGVTTLAQARALIDGAESELRAAKRGGVLSNEILSRLAALASLRSTVLNVSSAQDFRRQWLMMNTQAITNAYVTIAGITGTIQARDAVSLLDELKTSANETAKGIGVGVGALAGGIGNVAGSVVGGLLSGLGPVVVLTLAFALYVKFRKA